MKRICLSVTNVCDSVSNWDTLEGKNKLLPLGIISIRAVTLEKKADTFKFG